MIAIVAGEHLQDRPPSKSGPGEQVRETVVNARPCDLGRQGKDQPEKKFITQVTGEMIPTEDTRKVPPPGQKPRQGQDQD